MLVNLEIILYSLVQGFTEFLPVSSSAHLYFLEKFFSWEKAGVVFALGAHFGTLIAVIIHQRRKIYNVFFVDLVKKKDTSFLKFLAISILPVLLLGTLLATILKEYYKFNLLVIGFASIIGAILLEISDRKLKKNINYKDLNIRKALFIGIFQIFALVPGMSRSGTIITAMRFLGFDRNIAISFSLITGIPIILSACLYGFYSLVYLDYNLVGNFFLISILSFISAYFSIKFIMHWVNSFSFRIFVVYRIILGGVIVIYFFS